MAVETRGLSVTEEMILRAGYLVTRLEGLPEARLLRPIGEPPQIVIDGAALYWEQVGLLAEQVVRMAVERYGEVEFSHLLRGAWETPAVAGVGCPAE